VENYPELKANQNFLALQEELSSTENKIGFSRQNYNDQALFLQQQDTDVPVQHHCRHVRLHQAGLLRDPTPAEREVPKVSF